MNVQSFTLLGASALAGVQAALTQAVAGWAADWGVPATALVVRAERACECAAPSAASAWTSVRLQERQAHLALHPELGQALQRLLFAPDGSHAPQADGPSHFAASGARQACAALADALARAAMGGAQAATCAGDAPQASVRGAGAVMVVLQAGRLESRMLLNAACVRALAPAATAAAPALAPVNLWRALADVGVTLDLTIGAARVGLGNLMTLAPGDVIRLDAAVERPVTLTAPGGAPLLAAYLGKCGDRIAVEITGLT